MKKKAIAKNVDQDTMKATRITYYALKELEEEQPELLKPLGITAKSAKWLGPAFAAWVKEQEENEEYGNTDNNTCG